MMQPAVRIAGAIAAVLAAGLVAGGCAGAAATAGTASAPAVPSAAKTSAPVEGPAAPDAACLAARKAEQTLQARQGTDQASQSAIDQDFTNFASALNAAAQRATHPATARAMTALADDYTALVESQSGAAQLPSVATMQSDGAAFEAACP
jgi:Ca-activated chloride channel family protein